MKLTRILISITCLVAGAPCAAGVDGGGGGHPEAGPILVSAIAATDVDEQVAQIAALAETGNLRVEAVLTAWKRGEVYLTSASLGEPAAVYLVAGQQFDVATGEPVAPPVDLAASKSVDTSSKVRRAMKGTLDLLALNAADPRVRAGAALKLGLLQRPDYLPILEAKLAGEENARARERFREAIAISRLAGGDRDEVIESIGTLAELRSVAAMDNLNRIVSQQSGAPAGGKDVEIGAAAATALREIEDYLKIVDFFGTLFRGLSSGSVLIVAALGLAITFGLMGVINMAHGEMIAIGGYATFMVQQAFGKVFGVGGMGADLYFLVAIPISFVVAALMGVLLERGIIQFLYRRPLESLLATWGVSLVLQQGFRIVFGAANVQVGTPDWLQGSYEISDLTLGYNRLFVIVAVSLIVVGTWLLMTRTPLGLRIRAVMQNRDMAACMGVRTDRVRTATFAFGSGLAGLAGAFLSQIGNIGPNTGQDYIVDSFMVVVVGGVGNLIGTVVSALGIGVADQTLQPFLGPVMGKICVLVGIILFLQWKPGGLFPARTRSLDG
ncbi:urea ABC transporter permease subunit UrtB [soil metagenome]